MENIVEIKDLTISFDTYAGKVQAARKVSFPIPKGRVTAIVGESGCGKSVTAKAMMGLIQRPGKVEEGSHIYFEGKDILKFSPKEWRAFSGVECSIVFQDALTALNPTMNIGNQIVEKVLLHDKKAKKKDAWEEGIRMLEMVGIPNARERMRQYPHEFSGGMRQRAMIAIALMLYPKLLIADEPTTALDVTIQAEIIDLLKEIQKKTGMTIVLITHDLGIVANFASDIVVMYAGSVVETGTAEDIFYHPAHPYTGALLRAVPRLDVEEETLESIEGTPQDMRTPPKGCPFAERCRKCMEICREKMPEETALSKEHTVRCWLFADGKEGVKDGE